MHQHLLGGVISRLFEIELYECLLVVIIIVGFLLVMTVDASADLRLLLLPVQ